MDKSRQTQYRLFGILLGSILVIDQIVKIMVKTHMHIGEEIPLIGNWCLLNFTENNGFAFGISLGEGFGKILLSVFRLVASGALMWYMFKLIKRLIFAYKYKKAVKRADYFRHITHRKHMVILLDGKLHVIAKQDIKTFIRKRLLKKGTTVGDVEKIALYTTI